MGKRSALQKAAAAKQARDANGRFASASTSASKPKTGSKKTKTASVDPPQTSKAKATRSKTEAKPDKAITDRLTHPKNWGSIAQGTDHGRPADNAAPRSVPDIDRLLKASDSELIAIATSGRQQKAPDYVSPSPFRWSNGDTPVGIGLNEGYSVADVVHFHINLRLPADKKATWKEPDRLAKALSEGKIDSKALKMGLDKFRSNLQHELKSRAIDPPYTQPKTQPKSKTEKAKPPSVIEQALAMPTYKKPTMAQLKKLAAERAKKK